MWETRSVFHISMPRFFQQDGLRRWWSVSQRRMRPYRVVMHSPLLDHHLGLLQRVEDLSVQALIPELAVEAFTVPVLPGTAGLDVQRLRAHGRQPLPQSFRNKLGPIVGPQVFRDAV